VTENVLKALGCGGAIKHMCSDCWELFERIRRGNNGVYVIIYKDKPELANFAQVNGFCINQKDHRNQSRAT